MWLAAPDIAVGSQPGQFVMISTDGGSGRLLRRPISIHNIQNHKLALLFAVVGEGTDWLSRKQPGEKVDILGPLGHGFTLQPDSHQILLVAGGLGMAPLNYLARESMQKGCQVTLLDGARTAKLIYPSELLPESCHMQVATEDGSAGITGRITDLLSQYTGQADQVFICGPVPMYKAIFGHPFLKGKSVQVSLEVRMGCGLGFCYACTIKTVKGLKQVCKDGPVFDMNEVIWPELC